MKKILTVFLIGTFLIISFSCKNGIVDPPEDQPGRRNYIWSIDTIPSYNTIYRLWGSSPSDLWAITRGNFSESIFHFDGNKWSTDGKFRLLSPYSLWGFSKDNVYIGGGGGKIWHFDGNSWSEDVILTKEGHKDIVFDNMWGNSPNSFYAFGAYHDNQLLANNSVIAYYTNDKWTMLDTDGLIGIVEHLYKNKIDSKIYLQVIKFSESYDSTSLYEYNQDAYTKLYTTHWGKYWANISLINNEVYFILEDEVARRINNNFETILNLAGTNFYQNIWGRSSKDIFLEMTDGLAHYNGTDIQYLFNFNEPRTLIFGASLFENEIFFLVSEPNSNLIYHGRLME